MVKLPNILTPKRRWLQFSIRTMLCVTAVVAVICKWPEMRRYHAHWRLGEYADVNLKDLPADEKERVDDWIGVLVGSNENEAFPLFSENWLVHTANLPGTAQGMYVVEMEPLFSIPGSSYCRLHRMDRWGRLIRGT